MARREWNHPPPPKKKIRKRPYDTDCSFKNQQ